MRNYEKGEFKVMLCLVIYLWLLGSVVFYDKYVVVLKRRNELSVVTKLCYLSGYQSHFNVGLYDYFKCLQINCKVRNTFTKSNGKGRLSLLYRTKEKVLVGIF